MRIFVNINFTSIRFFFIVENFLFIALPSLFCMLFILITEYYS
jgi:hypothetical protein